MAIQLLIADNYMILKKDYCNNYLRLLFNIGCGLQYKEAVGHKASFAGARVKCSFNLSQDVFMIKHVLGTPEYILRQGRRAHSCTYSHSMAPP